MGSLSGWVETLLLSIVFLSIAGLVVSNFNILYGKNYQIDLSDNTDAEQRFIDYQETGADQLTGGEFDFSNGEPELKTTWGLALDVLDILWEFMSGGWIRNVIGLLQLGAVGNLLATTLQVLYVVGLILGSIYAFFKVTW